MDVSTMSDCVLLDNSLPTITLDETIAAEAESGEDISQDDEDFPGDETVEDGEVDENPGKYSKKKLMNIHFPDETVMQKFGPELIEFMQGKCSNLAVELDNSRQEITFFEKVIDLDDSEEVEQPIFHIDSTPSKGRAASEDIPRYTQSVTEALTNDQTPTKDNAPRRGASCFNCDGDHNLRDCKKPRNHQKINANRRAKGKNERYHVDLSQKYGHLRPGQISSKLAKALGLKSKDLPLHVFRMRKLGYPPGWLEEAKVSHSGINLFGSDGVVVLEDDEEAGEVEQVKDKYDPTKIIEYPGFNVDPPEDAYDDAKLFDCPPMQEDHRKETFLANLGVNLATAYKRRKMSSFPMNDSDVNGSVDMDVVEDEEDGETKEAQPPLPGSNTMLPPPPPADVPEGEQEEQGSAPTVNDSLVDFILTRDGDESMTVTDEARDTPLPEEELSPVTVDKAPIMLSSKEVFEGTPLLKSASEFDKLPDGDKWAVGVSDVINFENLPDSTGKYEKMKVLIKKVQKVVHQINNE